MAAFRQELTSLKMQEGLCDCASLRNWNACERMSQHVEASVGERRVWPLDYLVVSFYSYLDLISLHVCLTLCGGGKCSTPKIFINNRDG